MSTTTETAITINTAKDSSHLTQELSLMEISAKTLTIQSDDDYRAAADTLNQISSTMQRVEDFFGPDRDLAHKLHKSICNKLNIFLKPLEVLKAGVTHKMGLWKRQQLMASQAEQHQRDEAARKEADAATKKANELLKQGFVKEAAVYTELAESTIAIPQEVAVPKLEGVRESMPWTARITDQMELIKAIADGRVPLMHQISVKGVVQEVCIIKEWNQPVFTQMAKKQEKEFNWPGCVAEQEIRFSGSRK